MTDEDVTQVAVRYSERFDLPAPQPFGVSNKRMIEVLLAAIRAGRPVPDDFDWWDYLPPGAVA